MMNFFECKGLWTFPITICCLLVLLIAYYIQSHHWAFIKVEKNDFQDCSNLTVLPVCTVYYDLSSISTVLQSWDTSLKLYRLKPGQNYQYNIQSLSSSIAAKKLIDGCKDDTVLCNACFEKEYFNITLKDIFDPEHSNFSPWLASFSSISKESSDKLWESMNFSFKHSSASFEHAFLSNLEKGTMTAPIHGNPMTTSMAVQFVGRKTWMFFPPHVYIGLMGALPAQAAFPRHAPKEPFQIYIYESQPGDVIFFPENYGHIVYTHPGPSFMLTFRKLQLVNILRYPLTWITALLNGALFKESLDSAKSFVPFRNSLNAKVLHDFNELCVGGNTPFDRMIRALMPASS